MQNFNELAAGRTENVNEVHIKDLGLAGGHTRQMIYAFNHLLPLYTRGQAPQKISAIESRIEKILKQDSSIAYAPIDGPCSVEITFNTRDQKIDMQFFKRGANNYAAVDPAHVVVISKDDFPANFPWDEWRANLDSEGVSGIGESLVRQGVHDYMIPGHENNEISYLAENLMKMLYYTRFFERDLNPKIGYLENVPG